MKVKFSISLFLAIVFCTTSVFSQDEKGKPNFTGVWIINFSKSRINSIGLMSKDRKNIKCSSLLIIAHNEPEINLSEEFKCDFPNNSDIEPIDKKMKSIFFADSRGELNIVDNKNVESKTNWDGKKLVVTYYAADSQSGKKNRAFVREYKLSKDGKTLTRTSGNASTFGSADSKQPFSFSNSETLVFNLSEK